MAETIDIFELAAENSGYLRQQFQSIKENAGDEKVSLMDEFCKRLRKEWNLSANMSDWALVDWLDSGIFKNIYDVKDIQADELIETGQMNPSDKDCEVEEALVAHLDRFYDRRTVFDSAFRGGKKIKYFAVNIGGPGIDKYGAFCVVVAQDKAKEYDTLAFIKTDSAINYVDGGKLLADKLKHDLAVEECMPLLGIVKHENRLEITEPGDWDAMVCGDCDYMEAVTIENIVSSHIKTVRVKKSFYNCIYKDLLPKFFMKEKLHMEELYRMRFFKNILSELKKRSIELEIIDDN